MANTKYVICASLIASAAAIVGCSKNEAQPQAADESAPAQVEDAPAPEAAPEVAPASEVAPSPVADEAVLTIGEAALNRSDIDKAVAKIFAEEKVPEAQKEYAAQQIANQLAKSFIVSNVLGKKAKELGYSVTDEEVKAKEEEVIKGLAGRPNAPRSIDEAAEKSPMGKESSAVRIRLATSPRSRRSRSATSTRKHRRLRSPPPMSRPPRTATCWCPRCSARIPL